MDITHRRILKIVIPIVLANSTVPLLGAVDTFVVGQINSPVPIGAVAIGSLVISALYWFFWVSEDGNNRADLASGGFRGSS